MSPILSASFSLFRCLLCRYTTSMISDDPEMVHRQAIRNTSSLSRPDCATSSLKLNSAIVKRRAQFSTISWMVRRVMKIRGKVSVGM